MKAINKLWALAIIPMMTSCADYIDTYENFQVDVPESVVEDSILATYAPLKTYINREAHPGFLLGTGVSADDYLKRGVVYQLTNTNFDQVTLGNAMKYGSIVAENGSMNFSKVTEFVTAATDNGLSVYGHVLCWHEQQNVKWLNSLLADKPVQFDPNAKVEKVDVDYKYKEKGWNGWKGDGIPADGSITVNADGNLEVKSVKTPNFWDFQYHMVPDAAGIACEKGKTYTMFIKIRGSKAGTLHAGVGPWSGRANFDVPFTTDWKVQEIEFTAAENGGHMMAQNGDFEGTIEVEYVKIVHYEAPVQLIWVPLISNGNGATDDVSSFFVTEDQVGPNPGRVVNGEFVVNVGAKKANDWDNQFFIKASSSLKAGDKYRLSFKYKTTAPRHVSMQAHNNPGGYIHWSMSGGGFDATSEWKTYEYEGAISAEQAGGSGVNTIAFNLSEGDAAPACTFYFKDVVWDLAKEGNTIPLTPEERYDAIAGEANRWVEGMMKATSGKVLAWDLINECVSGADTDGDGLYDLNSAKNWGGDASNKFFWRDELGENFVRVFEKAARDNFKKYAGEGVDTKNLKLFINDFNLESDWDDNKKLKSLISWIGKWEADGTTKIDGIGTQMHISYHLNAATQKSKEDAIVKMFQLMAASKKLVRITELDMGLVGNDGKSIKTADVTKEQAKLMADHYKWIIKKYFEIIPVAQQYGICQWAQTDSPEGSGWRAGEPIGLWNANFIRKQTYAGFAEGLAEK